MAMQPHIRVLTWNILAHIHTHWDWKAHGGGERTCETASQMTTRHQKIWSRLAVLSPDVALLQEVDEFFLPPCEIGHTVSCGESTYLVLQSYSPTRQGPKEGTAVLLRCGVFALDPARPPVFLEKTQDLGWKNGLIVYARHCLSNVAAAFVSLHLSWDSPRGRARMLQSCVAALPARSPVVIGGDFNTEVQDLSPLEQVMATESASLEPLNRLPTPCGIPTGLDDQFRLHPAHTIDHIYTSQHWTVTRPCEVGALPDDGKGPYSETANDGSDHAWVLAHLALATEWVSPPPIFIGQSEPKVPNAKLQWDATTARLLAGGGANLVVDMRGHSRVEFRVVSHPRKHCNELLLLHSKRGYNWRQPGVQFRGLLADGHLYGEYCKEICDTGARFSKPGTTFGVEFDYPRMCGVFLVAGVPVSAFDLPPGGVVVVVRLHGDGAVAICG